VLRGKTEYKAELSSSPLGNMVKLENLLNGFAEIEELLQIKLEEFKRNKEQAKADYEKPFAHEQELKEKLKRQYELNTLLDLENGRVIDADVAEKEGRVAEPGADYHAGRTR